MKEEGENYEGNSTYVQEDEKEVELEKKNFKRIWESHEDRFVKEIVDNIMSGDISWDLAMAEISKRKEALIEESQKTAYVKNYPKKMGNRLYNLYGTYASIMEDGLKLPTTVYKYAEVGSDLILTTIPLIILEISGLLDSVCDYFDVYVLEETKRGFEEDLICMEKDIEVLSKTRNVMGAYYLTYKDNMDKIVETMRESMTVIGEYEYIEPVGLYRREIEEKIYEDSLSGLKYAVDNNMLIAIDHDYTEYICDEFLNDLYGMDIDLGVVVNSPSLVHAIERVYGEEEGTELIYESFYLTLINMSFSKFKKYMLDENIESIEELAREFNRKENRGK